MKANTQNKRKKAYRRPVLVSYGSLKELTTSGSDDGGEHTGVGNRDKRS